MNRKNFFELFIEREIYLNVVFVSLDIDSCINIATTETERKQCESHHYHGHLLHCLRMITNKTMLLY